MKKKIINTISDSKEIYKKLVETQSPNCKKMLCMYNSRIDAIITDPIYMAVTMEDKLIHRAYSAFDTTKIFKNKIFNLDMHINRLFESLDYINLKPMYSKDEVKDILISTAKEARNIEKESDIDLRFFYSAGLGNFLVTEVPDMHTFYVLAIKADTNQLRPINGTKDYLVSIEDIQKNIDKAKTTNYMDHCIINTKSKSKGGYLGIITDNEGNLLESPISNIAFINKNLDLVVPSFEKTLKGTTITKIMEYVEKELIPNKILNSISRIDTNIKDIQNGNILEAFFVGGDFLIPLLEIEDIKLYNCNYNESDESNLDKVGKFSRMFQEFLNKEKTIVAEDLI